MTSHQTQRAHAQQRAADLTLEQLLNRLDGPKQDPHDFVATLGRVVQLAETDQAILEARRGLPLHQRLQVTFGLSVMRALTSLCWRIDRLGK